MERSSSVDQGALARWIEGSRSGGHVLDGVEVVVGVGLAFLEALGRHFDGRLVVLTWGMNVIIGWMGLVEDDGVAEQSYAWCKFIFNHFHIKATE